MPKLPSVQSLGESPTPNPQRGVYSYRGDQVAQSEIAAAESMVQTGQQFMRAGDQIQDRVDRLEYSRAKAMFLRSKVEADNAFDDDQDYKTFEPRYRERLNKSAEQSLKNVSNGRVREALMADMALDFERGVATIKDKARGREKDENRAFLSKDIEASMQTALQADRPTAAAILESMTMQINASRDKGYLTAQEAEKMRQDLAGNYAVQRVSLMPPEKQLEALQAGMTMRQDGALPIFAKTGTEVDFIPPAKRIEMLRGAEAKTKSLRAIKLADDITGPMSTDSMDLKGWMEKTKGIADVELREAVESRIVTEYNRRNALVTQAERDLREKAWDVVYKTKSMDGLTGAQLAALKPADKIQMESYTERQGRVPDDVGLYNELNIMSAREPDKFMNLDLNIYRGKTSDQMVMRFSDLQRSMISAHNSVDARNARKNDEAAQKALRDSETMKGVGSAIKLAEGVLAKAGIDTKPKQGTEAEKTFQEFQSKVVDRVRDFQEKKKDRATDKEILGLIDGLLLEGRVRGGGWFGTDFRSDKRLYQVTPEERDRFFVPVEKIPAQDKKLIIEALRQKGAEPTNEAVQDAYLRMQIQKSGGTK